MDIKKIDRNFAVRRLGRDKNTDRYDINCGAFEIRGVFYENDRFVRMPKKVADSVNDGVAWLNNNTAGGRIRFRTDSGRVDIEAKLNSVGKMPHFAFSGSIGFDLYCDGIYTGTFMPPVDVKDSFSSSLCLPEGVHDVQINMPLYTGVSSVVIGLDRGAEILSPEPYAPVLPVVYYGSSITQGGCASRPGNSYQAIVSRRLNADYINLGFSGSAKGEQTVIDYICSLPMSVFVLDYDHNAPSPEHLRDTHRHFYDCVRAANPELPVLMMTRPKYHLTDDEQERLGIVRDTFLYAKNNGDENVYFIPGPELVASCIECATVDNCHPNDAGFLSMANAVEPVLRGILSL